MTNRRKIIMVQPQLGMSGAFVIHAPLGLLYASVNLVQENWPIEILDLRLSGAEWRSHLRSKLDDDTFIVGISVMTGSPIKNAIEIGKIVKSYNKAINIVWGGPFATFHPEFILRDDPNCDYVVSGYGSDLFAALVNRLSNGETPHGLAGIYYRDNGSLVEQPANLTEHEFIDWRKIPYHLIEDYSVYGQLDQNKLVFSLFSAMGCVYKCGFCSSPALYRNIAGKKWVPLSISDVVDHIEFIVEKYKADYIYFIDDDSFVDIYNVEKIINEIKKRGIQVKLGFRGARINEILKMDHAYLSKLVEAGTDMLHIGAESGSDHILGLIRKNCTKEEILEVNRKLAQHPDIFVFYNFIVGLPGETLQDLKETASLWRKLVEENPKCLIGMPNFFRPLPGTELFELARKEWGYEPPKHLLDFVKVEMEGTFRAPWFSKEHNKFCDMLQVTSYFIDDKIHKVTEGNSFFYILLSIISKIYAPIARYRVKRGYTGFFIERYLYRFASKLLTGIKRAGKKSKKCTN